MLFNSYEFLFLFLPLTFAVFWGLQKAGLGGWALTLLLLASLVFYSYWNPPFVLLLIGSIVFNHQLGRLIGKAGSSRKGLIVLGVGANLALLAFFKYLNFGIEITNGLFSSGLESYELFLPLGISFFTFQQVVYLSDIYYRKIEPAKLRDYALFISFFPHLLAGPITQPREILPQIQKFSGQVKFWDNLAIGLTLFIVGLFKKVMIADTFAEYANPVFVQAADDKTITFFDGWMGALGYSFQLYFDFSGYSDMAIGLGLMFGIVMPINFLSPYKSTSIAEFWRRWHMTMSRFFRDYIYIPLGGNRVRGERQVVNLFLTMALAGLWHGAGWTFIAWGMLHGLYLVVHHLYKTLADMHWPRLAATTVHSVSAHLLTMLAVVVGWVFFRAENFDSAFRILDAMTGGGGIVLPEKAARFIPSLGTEGFFRYSAEGLWHKASVWALPACILAYIFCVTAPSTMEFFGIVKSETSHRFEFQYRFAYAAVTAIMATLILFNMHRISEFLYFQF